MERFVLNRSLCSAVSSKNEVKKAIELFNNLHTNSADWEVAECFITFLKASIHRGHTQLAIKLLSDDRCHMKAVDQETPRPLFVAMRAGNLALVEALLRAGSSLTLNSPYLSRVTNDDKCHGLVNAFEYACLLSDHTMMRAVLSYNKCHNPHLMSHPCRTALHVVVSLASICWKNWSRTGTVRHSLASLVETVIRSGVNVNHPDEHGNNALCFLFKEVLILMKTGCVQDPVLLQVIVDTVKVLLEAGSSTDGGQENIRPFKLLVEMFFSCCSRELWKYANKLQPGPVKLLTDLLQMLIKHGSVLSLEQQLLHYIFVIATDVMRSHYKHPYFDAELHKYNILVDTVCDAYRSLVFAGAGIDNAGSLFSSNECLEISLINLISVITCLSFQSRQSTKLMYILLNTMSATQLNKLKGRISIEKVQSEFVEVPSQILTDEAFQFVSALGLPLSLQHLARNSIIKALSQRRVCKAYTLGLPAQLQQYILLS